MLELDDRNEVENWEHIEELWLWMKHILDLTIDIVSKDLAKAFFVSASILRVFVSQAPLAFLLTFVLMFFLTI